MNAEKIRIQKVLADAGVASRRASEEMIVEGRLTVNGKLVIALPCFVGDDDEIRVDGQLLRRTSGRPLYFLLNKRHGVLSQPRAGDNRTCALDDIRRGRGRLHCVWPLNPADSGLILATDDGRLAQELSHPRSGVEKTYLVEVQGRPTPQQLAGLKEGIYVGRWLSPPARVKLLATRSEHAMLEITMAEGKNRDIRRLLARQGLRVLKLRRSACGPITDEGLKPGRIRPLRPDEVAELKRLAKIE